MDSEGSSLKVLMFPWLGFGHISTYLNVAKKLANRGFCVHLCSTPINLSYIKRKISQKYSHSIQLIELHLSESPELPDPSYHTTNGLSPHLNSALRKALKMEKPMLSKIMENMKPDLLIYDVFQLWAEEVAHSHNIPAVRLLTATAAFVSYFFYLSKNPHLKPPFPQNFPWEMEQKRFCKMMEYAAAKEKDLDDKDFFSQGTNKQVALISSSKAIEAKYIDYIQSVGCYQKVIPVGPFGPMNDDEDDDNDDDGGAGIVHWLREKDEHSTVFVSFGSEHFLSKEDVEEIAFGLEHSNVNFIWVVRFPKGGEVKLEEALPQGFLERIGDRGRVVDGWAPQQKILSHPNIGGFVTHCGFNSIMESIDFGVPIIALPIHVDQPVNAGLMIELGVAVEIVRDVEGKVHREEVAQILKSFIDNEKGDVLRMRVRHISENSKSVNRDEMDAAVKELIQLCKNY